MKTHKTWHRVKVASVLTLVRAVLRDTNTESILREYNREETETGGVTENRILVMSVEEIKEDSRMQESVIDWNIMNDYLLLEYYEIIRKLQICVYNVYGTSETVILFIGCLRRDINLNNTNMAQN